MSPEKNKKKLIIASFISGIILMCIKFLAYYATSSNAILTDALESIINVIASGFAFYSVHLSALPKDKNHPYGHGKIEFFSAGFEGALIIFAGIFISYRAIKTFFAPSGLEALPEGMFLVALTIIGNTIMGYLLIKNGKKYNSLVLKADGQHLLVDSISSLILLVGLYVISLTDFYLLDSILSVLLAAFIFYNGTILIRKSIAGLMDETNDTTLTQIVQILRQYRKDTWIDVHNLRIQHYGSDLHIDCHVTLPYYMNLVDMHNEIKQFEQLLSDNFGNKVEVFVHVDPCLPECCNYCKVFNCPVRFHLYEGPVDWTAEVLYKNQKHYNELNKNTSFLQP